MNRRDFIVNGGALMVSGCASAPVLTGLWRGEGVEVDPGSFGNSAFVVVHHTRLPGPVGLFKNPAGYTAALLICTHKQCRLEPAGDRYACPCHGSEFSVEGQVLNGPAEKPLRTFLVEKTDPGKILIRI